MAFVAPTDPDGQPQKGASNGVVEPRLLRKLRHRFTLPPAERAVLAQMLAANVRMLGKRSILIEEGAAPNEIGIVLEGWACRSVEIDGQRQIVALYLPGDVCDLNAFVTEGMDSSITAIGPLSVAGISRSGLDILSRQCPEVSRALWWESLSAATIQRRWTVNVAQRSAKRRLAHLICELIVRLDAVDLVTDDGECGFPLSQSDLGDACGMTSVHTNRTLQELRARGLFTLADNRLQIQDFDGLGAMARFSPHYLLVTNAAPRLEVRSSIIGGGRRRSARG